MRQAGVCIGFALACSLLFMELATQPASAQDLEKVLRQAHAALGETGTVSRLRSLRAQGDLHKQGASLTGDVRIDYRAPSDFALAGELDPDAGGRRTWIATPRDTGETVYDAEGNSATSALDSRISRAIRHCVPAGLPLFADRSGREPSVDRLDILGSRTFYPVTLPLEHDEEEWYAVDAADGVILRWELRRGGTLEVAVDFRKHRLVEGMRLPFEIEVSGPEGRLFTVVLRSWRINPELTDSSFTMGAPLPTVR
jgi:hypothetical protein